MCGIAGVLYADAARPVDADVLRNMADELAHRGPDADGYWLQPGVGLAHRRLSIIDLNGGDQPIGNEDGSIQVVFNGEIYNFPELRRQLESRGHRFRTRTDTEVLVHLYEECGTRLVEQLRGMFAFALWDHPRRRLLLARDRIGLKPLYVYRDGEKLLFGSEIKAILAHPSVDRAIDPAGVEDYLAFGMIPGARSIFQRVQKLPAAHVLSIDAKDLQRSPHRYWRMPIEADESRSIDDWLADLRAKLDETVDRHRIADVPVGAFLSGGLDSSVIVATLSRLGGERLRTFSIGFREQDFSELHHAREVARVFGTDHVEEVVTPEAIDGLHDLVRFFDEPFADVSAIPTMLVSRVARRSVKVALSGDGGDEAFGGYDRYVHDLRESHVREWIPPLVRRGLVGPMGRLWPKADWLPRLLRAKTTLTNLALEPAAAYANTLCLCRQRVRRRLLSPDMCAELNGHRPEEFITRNYAGGSGDALRGMISADMATLLPDDFLTKVDRASMACGLEVRPPLVDHEFLELAFSVPSNWKIRGGETKWLLKRMYRDRLPSQIVSRGKQGFDVPIDAWLRGPLKETLEQTVLAPDSPLSEIIDQRYAQRLNRAHQTRTGRHGGLLWSLLVLDRWMNTYLRPPPTLST